MSGSRSTCFIPTTLNFSRSSFRRILARLRLQAPGLTSSTVQRIWAPVTKHTSEKPWAAPKIRGKTYSNICLLAWTDICRRGLSNSWHEVHKNLNKISPQKTPVYIWFFVLWVFFFLFCLIFSLKIYLKQSRACKFFFSQEICSESKKFMWQVCKIRLHPSYDTWMF